MSFIIAYYKNLNLPLATHFYPFTAELAEEYGIETEESELIVGNEEDGYDPVVIEFEGEREDDHNNNGGNNNDADNTSSENTTTPVKTLKRSRKQVLTPKKDIDAEGPPPKKSKSF